MIFSLSSALSFDILTLWLRIFQIFMCVKLNSLFDREMKVYYVTQVLKQGVNIKTMCPNSYLNLETQSLIYCKSI